MTRVGLAILLCFGLLWLSACGYRLTGSRQILPGEIATLDIPVFENRTARAFLEVTLTDDVRSRFARFTGVELRLGDPEAEGRLGGRIVAYEVKASAFDAFDNIIEYTATMRVDVTLKRQASGETLWRGEIAWDGTFPGGGDKNLQEVNQQKAIEEISERIAGEILYRMLLDF